MWFDASVNLMKERSMSELIRVNDLVVSFRKKNSKLFEFKPELFNAIDHVGLAINKGEIFGLVGESGSGKSTIGKTILGYYKPSSGNVLYEGCDLHKLKTSELKPYRKKMQSIFQDPYSSLDPSMTVKEIISEPMDIHGVCIGKERTERIAELLESVGMEADDMKRYPHEFSGGQKQRISIARSLSVDPEFIVCDEPISALDVSLQAQIVYMLQKIQKEKGLTFLFISHQLHIIEKICDRIGVLYLGNMMEIGTSDEVCIHPLHPYTQMLMSSVLEPDPRVHSLDNIRSDSGEQVHNANCCKFCNRCPYATDRCKKEIPSMVEVTPGHSVACFNVLKSH